MRKAGAALVLASALSAHDRDVALPAAASLSAAPAAAAMTVILTKDGGLFLEDGSTPIDLDLLGKALAASALPKEKHGDVEISMATIRIRADRDAPWQHVQWILRSCAESRIRRIQLAACNAEGEGVVDVTLPIDDGRVVKRAPRMHIVTHVVACKEAPARVGGRDVLKPAETRYRFGDSESADVKELTQWAREALGAARKAGEVVECEIEGGHKVPFGAVLAALATIRGAGVDLVILGDTKEPDADQRRAIPLPYPERNYDEKN